MEGTNSDRCNASVLCVRFVCECMYRKWTKGSWQGPLARVCVSVCVGAFTSYKGKSYIFGLSANFLVKLKYVQLISVFGSNSQDIDQTQFFKCL